MCVNYYRGHSTHFHLLIDSLQRIINTNSIVVNVVFAFRKACNRLGYWNTQRLVPPPPPFASDIIDNNYDRHPSVPRTTCCTLIRHSRLVTAAQ